MVAVVAVVVAVVVVAVARVLPMKHRCECRCYRLEVLCYTRDRNPVQAVVVN